LEDTLIPLASFPGFTAVPAVDWDELAEINHLSYAEVMDRRNNGHRPYVARMYGQPLAYGWLATSEISIGELDINVELPLDDRYLWDFATLPDWQGRGLYPRLLQSILEQEIQIPIIESILAPCWSCGEWLQSTLIRLMPICAGRLKDLMEVSVAVRRKLKNQANKQCNKYCLFAHKHNVTTFISISFEQ
jgi:hypothetical protein